MANMARYFLNLICTSCLLLAGWPGQGWAAQEANTHLAKSGHGSAPLAGERLSDWLLRQAPDERAYSFGLTWQVPAERVVQSQLKVDLLAELSTASFLDEASRNNLLALTSALPVTGRVRLPMVDARWLQANPAFDPVLQRDHEVSLPLRPKTVSVLTAGGKICRLPHQPGAQARHYLEVCDPQNTRHMDRAWVVQADGSVADYLIAFWNERAQDEPAPGALIWGALRSRSGSERLSRLLTDYLATQPYDAFFAQAMPVHEVAGPAALQPGRAAMTPLLSASDWGMVGLLQTPTARMAAQGDARFHFSRIYPYERLNVFVQPFDALEAGFRYTTVLNRLYGSASLSGSQTYKDKSMDFKFRLFEETAYRPQLAVGIIDAGGTGLFSSEFVVANKRFGRFDASLGLGWGYLGSSGNIKNPFSAFGANFDKRGAGAGTGGQVNTQAFFRGPTALFGGIQYQPWDNWVFKAEYDGNHYRNEPQSNNHKQRTPLNFGVVYRPSPSVNFSAGLERGNTLMLGLTLHTSLPRLGAPKVSDTSTPKVAHLPPRQDVPLWTGTAADIVDMSGWGVQSISRNGRVLQVVLEGASGAHWSERVERIAAVLHRDAPASIDTFDLILTEQGVVLAERQIRRSAWVKANATFSAPSQREQSIVSAAPRTSLDSASQEKVWTATPSRFAYAVVPSWQQNIGGPDGFLLFRAGVSVPMQWKLASNVSLSGAVSLNLLDNFDKFKYTAPSNMPRVKTYLREYMTSSRLNVPNLQVTHFGQWSDRQFYSVYAGYLESMYAGVGGEWLYRPWHSPFALGVDVNRVQQRNFDQLFGFDRAGTQTGYRVDTGHATVYWDTGWESVHLKLSAGRYLAGDIGATIDASKTFDNGVSVGVWATRTNVSAERFGEGSFDKGLYLRIPFDVMTTKRSGNTAFLAYSPLTRDGGARLNRSFTLHGATMARSQRETGFVPAQTNAFRSAP